MKTLQAAIVEMLREIYDRLDVQSKSRRQVEAWLVTEDLQDFIAAFEEILVIATEVEMTPGQFMTRLALEMDTEPIPQVQPQFFREGPLPPGLTGQHLQAAMDETQSMIARINRSLCLGTASPLIRFIQANNFSGIVSNVLTDSLNRVSPYQHNHDQRFPDLKNPVNGVGVEVKASNKPGKGGESHNGHGGWHLVSCFDLDEESGNILFVHIEIAELIGYVDEVEGDWHYCGSTMDAETGSQRTETYYTTGRGTSKLRDGSVYLDTDRVANWQRWRHDKSYPIPPHSPLYFRHLDNRRKVPSLNDPERLVLWSIVKNQLNVLDPLWPLYDRERLLEMGVPVKLADVIRPATA